MFVNSDFTDLLKLFNANRVLNPKLKPPNTVQSNKKNNRERRSILKGELKMNMQCRDMKADGIIRDKECQIRDGFKKKFVEIEGQIC
ncbi:MAG: hypothetical protein QG657_605 [Acidobacteriota bacterium]|nr:hypothetical protein [Acidobacteriota bacterium]